MAETGVPHIPGTLLFGGKQENVPPHLRLTAAQGKDPILLMKDLKHRAVKLLAQGHTARG